MILLKSKQKANSLVFCTAVDNSGTFSCLLDEDLTNINLVIHFPGDVKFSTALLVVN